MTQPQSPDLTQVLEAFETWRRTRERKGPIPDALWSAALSLLDRYPINEVCRALRLSGQQLRERRERNQPTVPNPAFLELTARELTSIQPVASLPNKPVADQGEPVVEPACLTAVIERRDGGKLSLTLPVSELSTMITSFVRA